MSLELYQRIAFKLKTMRGLHQGEYHKLASIDIHVASQEIAKAEAVQSCLDVVLAEFERTSEPVRPTPVRRPWKFSSGLNVGFAIGFVICIFVLKIWAILAKAELVFTP